MSHAATERPLAETRHQVVAIGSDGLFGTNAMRKLQTPYDLLVEAADAGQCYFGKDTGILGEGVLVGAGSA